MLSIRIALTAAVAMVTVASYAQWSSPADDVAAYHSKPPAAGAKLPPLLSGKQFPYPWQKEVYREAAKIPNVIYQLPCNCRCDRALGHQSLRSCYETNHGAECDICAKEAIYAYRLTKQGKTPAQIRDGIARKEYEKIDLESVKPIAG